MAHLTLRLPDDTVKQVDEVRARLEKQNGIPVNRADALRMLINKGLEQDKKDAKP